MVCSMDSPNALFLDCKRFKTAEHTTSYVCGLNDQSKDMYEDYQRRFAEDPFNEETVRVGDALLDEISEAQRSKWKEMIESTDFTHSSRKA